MQQSSTYYGGTEGWMAAEMLMTENSKEPLELDTFLKADIFSLGLLGVYILSGKHPFAPTNTDGLTRRRIMRSCQDNIEHKKVLPFFSTLEEDAPEKDDRKCEKDALAVDLCKTMLSHEPEKRPTIREVLGHCMFWHYKKLIDFLVTVYCQYFGDKEISEYRKKHGTDKQKMAYKPLSRSILPKDEQLPKVQRAMHKRCCRDFNRKSTLSDRKKRKEEQIRDVITNCWMDRIEQVNKQMETNFYAESHRDVDAYPYYSLRELLRYIRNYFSHPKEQEEEFKFIAFVSEAFPNLIPFVYKMMKKTLGPKHKEIYQEITKSEALTSDVFPCQNPNDDYHIERL